MRRGKGFWVCPSTRPCFLPGKPHVTCRYNRVNCFEILQVGRVGIPGSSKIRDWDTRKPVQFHSHPTGNAQLHTFTHQHPGDGQRTSIRLVGIAMLKTHVSTFTEWQCWQKVSCLEKRREAKGNICSVRRTGRLQEVALRENHYSADLRRSWE